MSDTKPKCCNELQQGRSGAAARGRDFNPWADLVVAMLSVNRYPITKTFGLFEQLEDQGLFDPRRLAQWDTSEIARRLGASGYDRGNTMTAIFTERIASLGCLAAAFDENTAILQEGSREEIVALLRSVKGVGPTVLSNFFLLRG